MLPRDYYIKLSENEVWQIFPDGLVSASFTIWSDIVSQEQKNSQKSDKEKLQSHAV